MSKQNQEKSILSESDIDFESQDSGVFSGLISSREILSEDCYPARQDQEEQKPSNIQQQDFVKQQQQYDFHQQEFDSGILSGKLDDTSMHLQSDSGVCSLSKNLSELSLKNPNLNNLSGKIQTSKQIILDDLPYSYYEQDDNGDTHLHISIAHGFLDAALALIQVAPNPRLLDTPNDDAETPLHLAVALGQFQVARWLIVSGAKPFPRNLHGDSPLHIASKLGDIECVKAIADPVTEEERKMMALSYHPMGWNYDIDQWNYSGQTCVHVAALSGNVDVVRHLVRCYGANINAQDGKLGYTALHFAIERQDEQLVQFILSECDKLDVEVMSYGGLSPLEIGVNIKSYLRERLLNKGVPYSSPSTSDEEDSEDDFDYSFRPSTSNIPVSSTA